MIEIIKKKYTPDKLRKEYPSFTGKLIVLEGNYGFDAGTFYYKNGKQHREEGPAVEFVSGTKVWLLHGKYISEEEHKNWQRSRKLEAFLDEDS